jgi:cytochrome c oxidase assembly factor CtaG
VAFPLAEHWGAPPAALGVAAVALGLHGLGGRRLRPGRETAKLGLGDGGTGRLHHDRGGPGGFGFGQAEAGSLGRARPASLGQAWVFRGGVALALLVAASPLGYWSSKDVSARATEDVLLSYAVAPLLVLGAPWLALAAGVARDGAARLEEWLERCRPSRAWRVVSSPLFALVAFSVAFWLWRVPPVVDAAPGSSVLHGVELASCLLASLPFWGQLVGSEPFAPRLDMLSRAGLVLVAMTVTFIVGVAMVFSNSSWYPAYRGTRGAYLSAVADQGVTGAAIWVLPCISLGVVLFWVLIAWLNRDSDDDWRLAQLIDETRAGLSKSPYN